jgi:GntR family transcriptional regulator
MRFWITKNSEVPVHEQLARQVMLAILSEELPAGERLPSTRALARRYHIHPNTVSAAWHDLLDRGWVELRRGSGLYVRPLAPADPASGDLDALLAETLRAARARGHKPEDVLHRLEQLILPRSYNCIAVVDPEDGMREVLRAEIGEQIKVTTIQAADVSSVPIPDGCLVTALAARSATVRERLPRGIPFLPLRLRSVRESLEGETRPAPNDIILIVSGSADFRRWARTMLIAVGLDPQCLCELDTGLAGWRERTGAGALVVADVVAARGLPAGSPARVFRVVADSCIAELKQLCGQPL